MTIIELDNGLYVGPFASDSAMRIWTAARGLKSAAYSIIELQDPEEM